MSFNLNIQRRYHPDNYNHAERLSRGIGEAIAMHEQSESENREFENDVALEGGENIPAESRPARINRIARGVGGAIRRKLPGYDAVAEAEQNMAKTPPVLRAGAGARPEIERIHGAGIEPTAAPRRATIGGAIGDDLEPVERAVVRGPHGQSAIVPTRRGAAEKAKRADRAEWEYRTGIEQKNRLEVEKSKGRATEAEKQANRMALVDRRAAITQQLRSTSLTAYERASLEARQRALDAAIDRDEASNSIQADAALSRLPSPDPTDRRILGRDPSQAAATARTDAQRAAAQRRLEERGKGKKTYSTDPKVKRAQELWDSTPAIQKARPRPQ